MLCSNILDFNKTLIQLFIKYEWANFLFPAAMSGILDAIKILRDAFNKYAGKEGDKDTLTKRELAEMLRTEFGIVSRNDVTQ